MVWAGIFHDGRTQLKIVQGILNVVNHMDDNLDLIVPPFLQQGNFVHVFQHDNARCHVARICQDFLNRVLPWPALPPDMSPIAIEHLWDELGRRVHHRQNPPEILQEMHNIFGLNPKRGKNFASGIVHGIFIKPPLRGV
jgi:hypothetical protein